MQKIINITTQTYMAARILFLVLCNGWTAALLPVTAFEAAGFGSLFDRAMLICGMDIGATDLPKKLNPKSI